MKECAADCKDCREGSLECNSSSGATLSGLEKAPGDSSHQDALLHPWVLPWLSPSVPSLAGTAPGQAHRASPAVTRERGGLCALRGPQGRNVRAL